MSPRTKELSREFQSFLDAKSVRPPSALDETILGRVGADLNPSVLSVFTRLALIHTVTGMLTLLVCPQFGINILPGMGLMGLFMQFGPTACMFGCGAFFLGSSALAAALLLTPEQIRVLRRSRTLLLSALALGSMGIFACAGASFVLSLAVAWMAGSMIGGLTTLWLGFEIRQRRLQ